MSPIDRAGPLAGTNFALGLYKKTQPGFRDEKRSKILGTSFGAKKKNKTKMAKRNRVITFTPIMALATLLAVSLQLNGSMMTWKIHQAKQNDAIRAALLRKRNFSSRRLKLISQRCLNRRKRTCWHKPGRTDLWRENIWTRIAPEESSTI